MKKETPMAPKPIVVPVEQKVSPTPGRDSLHVLNVLFFDVYNRVGNHFDLFLFLH